MKRHSDISQPGRRHSRLDNKQRLIIKICLLRNAL